jgi:poly-beta-1,6-N-acetyl-D-glucosamine synthase
VSLPQRLLVISPVRNEGEHLDAVAASLEQQTRRPDLWLIVDDNSTDATPLILRRLDDQIDWLRTASMPASDVLDRGDRLALGRVERVFNRGLDLLDWREFTHVGKLDGDVLLPGGYFERMLERFAQDPRLGLAGGALTERRAGRWVTVATPEEMATGQARIYSRACLAAVGGIPERLGADPIADTYARMTGFTSRTFADLPFRHLRQMGSAQGALRGRARQGAAHYIVHYSLPWAVLRAGKMALGTPPRPLSGPAFLFGYLRAAAGGTRRVEDPAFRAFARAEQRRRMASALVPGRR